MKLLARRKPYQGSGRRPVLVQRGRAGCQWGKARAHGTGMGETRWRQPPVRYGFAMGSHGFRTLPTLTAAVLSLHSGFGGRFRINLLQGDAGGMAHILVWRLQQWKQLRHQWLGQTAELAQALHGVGGRIVL